MVVAVTGLGQAFADLGLSEATIQTEDINHNQVSILFWVNAGIGATLTILWHLWPPSWLGFIGTTGKGNHLCRVSYISHFGSEGPTRSHPKASNAIFISRHSRRCFPWPRSVCRDHDGVAGNWLSGLSCHPPGSEFRSDGFFVADGPLGTEPAARDTRIRSMIAFGSNVAVSYVIFTINRSADNLLVGWYWGAGPLGLYSRAYNLLMLPVRQLSAPASSIAILPSAGSKTILSALRDITFARSTLFCGSVLQSSASCS